MSASQKPCQVRSPVSDFVLRLGFSVLVGTAISAGILLAVLEYYKRRKPDAYLSRNVWLSLSMIGPNVLTYTILAPWWAFAYQQAAGLTQFSWPVTTGTLAAAFVVCDLSYFTEHSCGHRFRFLWGLHHGAHHTSDLYNVPLAYRVSFMTQFVTPVFYLPWVLLGLHPLVVLGFQLFVFHYQAWLHTEQIGRLGVLDRLINTPAVHRVHHSAAPDHKAVNLGGVLMIWDHLFRTYRPPLENLTYGIAGRPATSSYTGLYLDPWRSG